MYQPVINCHEETSPYTTAVNIMYTLTKKGRYCCVYYSSAMSCKYVTEKKNEKTQYNDADK